MKDEDAFQEAIDDEPHDHMRRLVFADWLDEQGDERGPGYRALGELKLAAEKRGDFWNFLPVFTVRGMAFGPWYAAYMKELDRYDFGTRQCREDAMARAFARLTDQQQADTLAAYALAR